MTDPHHTCRTVPCPGCGATVDVERADPTLSCECVECDACKRWTPPERVSYSYQNSSDGLLWHYCADCRPMPTTEGAMTKTTTQRRSVTEACLAAMAEFPGRTVFMACTAAFHSHTPDTPPTVTWRLTIQPGFGDSGCDGFNGRDPDECLAQVRAARDGTPDPMAGVDGEGDVPPCPDCKCEAEAGAPCEPSAGGVPECPESDTEE